MLALPQQTRRRLGAMCAVEEVDVNHTCLFRAGEQVIRFLPHGSRSESLRGDSHDVLWPGGSVRADRQRRGEIRIEKEEGPSGDRPPERLITNRESVPRGVRGWQ